MLGNICRSTVVVMGLILVSPSLFAQGSWADALVDKKKLEFGVIATGAEAVQVVSIENSTSATLHISSWTTACRCAEASAPGKTLLQPGEKTFIEVRMNTRSFKGQRDTSLSIYFDSPQFAEVRVPISAYIRTDIVFEPSSVDFGSLDFLSGGKKTVRIAYAGRPDWNIRDVKFPGKDLTGKLTEVSRVGGNVVYDLEVTLDPKTKPGRFRDIITLVTDDAAHPNVPLITLATVVPDIRITTPDIAVRNSKGQLVPLKPGETTIVKVILQGNKPFLIQDVDCQQMQDCFEVKMSEKENKLQIVEMKFTAPEKVGKFSEEMIVKIQGREDVLKFNVSGSIAN
jgi:hypothetical protein